MTFTCKYCGEKYCSNHRLPEKHDCEGLEEGVKKKSGSEEEEAESQKWFQEKDVRDELKIEEPKTASRHRKPSGPIWWMKEAFRSLKNNATLSIIGFTTLIFMIQASLGNSAGSTWFYSNFVLSPVLTDLLAKPWTLITVMFLHAGTFHLFANMITLYFFGKPIENLASVREFLMFYFGSGILASLGFVAFRNSLALIHGQSALGPAVGASGAVVACFAAVAMLYPDAEVLLYFIIPMKVKTALYAFGGFELLLMATKVAGISHPLSGLASSAHLTGMIVGVWYGRKLRERSRQRASVLDLLGA